MTDFEKFHDESDSSDLSKKSSSKKSSSKKSSSKKVADDTESKFFVPNEPIEDSDEFRNEKLDYNYKRNPIMSWLKMMFPHFKIVSITVAFTVIILLLYLVEILLWVNNRWSCVTYSMGSNYTPAIKRGHIQRLAIPGLLHNDLPHLLWNCFVLLAVGSNAEYYLGSIGYGALLGASILLGNCFTAAFRFHKCSQSIGSGNAIMAILAFELIWAIFNITRMGLSKWLYVMYFGTIFLTTVMGTFVAGHIVDVWGHLAGFIAGICVTCFFYKELQKFSFMSFGRFAFIVIYGVLLVFSVIMIFFKNTKLCYPNICSMKLNYDYF